MPRSLVLYTTKDIYSLFEETLADTFRDYPSPPYTLSFPQKTRGDSVRVRITEMTGDAVDAIAGELAETGRAILASDSEPDVKSTTYRELQENADRSRRDIRLQFSSPTLLRMGAYDVQFPVVPLLFRHYMGVWNTFSPDKITFEPTLLEHVSLVDFRISREKGFWGVGFQGWVDLEIGRGRAENEIALLNMLCDYSFYCGTGVETHRGPGQTRRLHRER